MRKYTNTNTQIQHMTECQKDPMCGIYLKRGLFKDVKNYIPRCWTHKYKNTNTQIHKYTDTAYDEMMKGQKDPICGIFLKRGLFWKDMILATWHHHHSEISCYACTNQWKFQLHTCTILTNSVVPVDSTEKSQLCTCTTWKNPVMHVHDTKSSSCALD